MSDHADTIRGARYALKKIGEGEWTPQDLYLSRLVDVADALAARCDALEQSRIDAETEADRQGEMAEAAEARCDALENENAELRGAIRQYLSENGMKLGDGPLLVHPRFKGLVAALAATDTTRERRVTHGPDCPCTPCRREDWTKIAAGLPPAGERQET